ncbi:hypothetical protein [Hymenobacter cheonanensis]|uniref:hypothetical protein n=1 Tax=Hymenobacter sp. CA2-7 TaxID=3063993 RepID=UPI00271368C1|nr:hypothetical protein [Hymenobacter sp. CA2-7]MDO7884332.1 hypothetical protein [Hymenobacter sp. CA2-7]
MHYRLALLAAFLTTTAAKAQLIANPARALAARDTLLQQATQLRQQVQAQSAFFTANGHTPHLRRQVVRGIVKLTAGAGTATTTQLRWRQVTRYRRNGRVQEHFLVKTSSKLIMDEHRLNGHTLRLVILSQVPGSGSLTPRHLGKYWQSGYVLLDRKQYALPQPAQ